MRKSSAAVGRSVMAEACVQAANLYDALAGTSDRYTPSRARALRAAAAALADGPSGSAVDVEEVLAAVSVAIGLRESVSDPNSGTTLWVIDNETMKRLEAAYAPVRAARHAPAPVREGEPDAG